MLLCYYCYYGFCKLTIYKKILRLETKLRICKMFEDKITVDDLFKLWSAEISGFQDKIMRDEISKLTDEELIVCKLRGIKPSIYCIEQAAKRLSEIEMFKKNVQI